ncbi:tetrahydrodipicolinate N-succinyltransferase N-terminal domain-containing protein [Helicobacter suis]|uniref:tetrahydrodipicolinate N-succinyltransferase N-terminal domain-containing protein n=1 Tax=Helicobacter suis TaxID=104628 RepID=UPI002490F72E|nr:tetrahydrodipicolinate N-succinyltransferase N-terminal domain-containing protein [Helicobacter suis]
MNMQRRSMPSFKPLAFGIAKMQYGQKSQKPLSACFLCLEWQPLEHSILKTLEGLKPLSKTPSEAIYSIDKLFLKQALPYISQEKTPLSEVLLALNEQEENPQFSFYHFVILYEDGPCQSLQTAYLKLHALSLGKAPLRSLNLEGIFALLPNVAWSGNKAYELEWLREHEISLKMQDKFPCIDFVDKFPRYLMQIIPQFDNIRLLDSAKARFGAYLGKGGYTQMPGASYINFNAGVEGACMNEGRISSSVIVGEGTDIGGGAGILGVLSGGNSKPISVGKDCLLGVNSVLGISLGNGCIVDAGIGVLAGTIFYIASEELAKLQEINPQLETRDSGLYKGRELSGLHGLHFRQHSQTGKMVVLRSTRSIALNTDLHH